MKYVTFEELTGIRAGLESAREKLVEASGRLGLDVEAEVAAIGEVQKRCELAAMMAATPAFDERGRVIGDEILTTPASTCPAVAKMRRTIDGMHRILGDGGDE